MEISGISFGVIILYFVAYLIIHIVIAIYQKYIERQLEEKPANGQLTQHLKYTNIGVKWFPALYIMFIIARFYL